MSSYEERYKSLIEDDVNVSSHNDGKDFLILLAGLVALVFCLIVFANIIANIVIDIMPDKAQMKIENLFGEMPTETSTMLEYESYLMRIEKLKSNIIMKDISLMQKSKFPIRVIKNDDVNAWIMPNGTIYFTTTLLNENLSDEELTFVLAHEIGHYKNRDHLKNISKQLVTAFVYSILFLADGNSYIASITNNLTAFENLTYSRNQEKEADLYGTNMLISLYGTQDGAIKFMERIKAKSIMPEFVHYFSTHPAPSKRIQYIQTVRATSN